MQEKKRKKISFLQDEQVEKVNNLFSVGAKLSVKESGLTKDIYIKKRSTKARGAFQSMIGLEYKKRWKLAKNWRKKTPF